MSIKKTVIMTVFISAIFVGASFMVAQAYEPLVRIPGLPATGDINLSQYVVGLYNFLLSIVGIVAVMMLIIGGMKYITAAGNASIIADAKDTISNAIFGLLLALLSWVIVSTINPDVLYIKHPASSLTGAYTDDLGQCGTFDPLALPAVNCTCKDETILGAADQDACHITCKNPPSRCNLSDPLPCIKGGSSNNPILNSETGFDECHCVDGDMHVVVNYGPAPAAPDDAGCNKVCSNPDWAVDGEYHGINWRLKVGHNVNGTITVPEGENFTVNLDQIAYYDFSEIKDCSGNLIHFYIDFAGKPADWIEAIADPHKWCCMNMAANCASTWGDCCNAGGCWIGFNFHPPDCYDLSDMNPSESYPIFKHTYTSEGIKTVWVGISANLGGTNCKETNKFFQIDVVP